jgi:hypothetical protein
MAGFFCSGEGMRLRSGVGVVFGSALGRTNLYVHAKVHVVCAIWASFIDLHADVHLHSRSNDQNGRFVGM